MPEKNCETVFKTSATIYHEFLREEHFFLLSEFKLDKSCESYNEDRE